MPLTQLAKTYLEGVNIDPDKFEVLLGEEPPEDLDVNLLITEQKSIYRSVFEKEFLPEIKQTIASETYGKATTKQMRDLNKKYNLGYTENELKELSIEDFNESLAEKFPSKTVKSDKPSEYETKYNTLVGDIDVMKSEFDKTLSAAQQQHQAEIQALRQENQSYIQNSEFANAFASVNWGKPKEELPMWMDFIKRQILENYHVGAGVLLDKDGKSKALNFKKNGSYETLGEAVQYLVNHHKLEQVSGGSNTVDPVTGNAVKKTSDDMSDQANKLLAEAQAAGVELIR